MKFLFKLLVGLLIFVGLILFLFYKDAKMPIDDYNEVGASTNMTEMISEQVDEFLDDSSKPLHIGFKQSNANNLIRNTLVDQMNGNTTDFAYVLSDSMYGFQGVWTKFEADKVFIESGVHLFVGPITYKTRIMLAFNITEDDGVIVLKLDKFNIGKLPLAWISGPASSLYKAISGQDISNLVNDSLGNIGTFDMKKRTLTVDLRDFIDAQIDDPQQKATLEAVLNIVYDNELIDIKAVDKSLGVDLNLNKLSDTTPVARLANADRITSDEEFQLFFESKMPGAFASLLVSDELVINFNELDTNKLIDYLLTQGDLTKTSLITTPIVEGYEVVVETPHIVLSGDKLLISLPLLITTDDLSKQFKSVIKIETTLDIDGKDLKINFTRIDMGEISIDSTDVHALLSGANVELMTQSGFVIKDFTDNFNQEGMTIKDLEVESSTLKFTVETSADLSVVRDVIEEGLQDIVDNITDPDVKNLAEDILAQLDDPVALEEAINEFSGLLTNPNTDPAVIDQVLDLLNGALDGVDLYDLLP